MLPIATLTCTPPVFSPCFPDQSQDGGQKLGTARMSDITLRTLGIKLSQLTELWHTIQHRGSLGSSLDK